MAKKDMHKPSAAGKANPKMPEQTRDSKVPVLVVDDDVKIVRFISSSLKLAGYEVCTATCGEEALRSVISEKPHIIILDILMSPMNGFEVLRRLRAESELPVIAISAHSSSAEKALNLGANVFLAKPFRPDELIKRVQSVLK